ncbi:DarT ssDNA thymidine ADP-ribosyltransferase family protein [Bacillus cereus]|uniref:DarT ssDNA thymidine ADP-ribosyltransferase family protein n=1 Tax=Bacillus TaxID=1386 RepID=UPI000BED3DB0|nr:DarT ssDNA thymidine ADP-ribosyltransferase family protein [Bacillus cereus]MDG1632677.1 DarT ssDNA thymidine ADP-ribosyltransferase family protein [Bacillus cereus]MDK7408797.1 DarT ssDNA thymidine ADP-ribosyltransferase family protein [Bacillus cereus]MDK7414433.1 DarT ssDNA thymidine ADP-ribosyltransferase family protein [Bacillus cereus]PEB35721.1 hypothetical protein COM77_12205 [Bacillus cereus]HDX9542103.1 DUF4433 domain-containing protein [Bacillus cereus]
MVTVISCKELLRSPDVVKYLPYGCKWWSKYIFHFSHITNIASILNDGQLISRNLADLKKMHYLNDNASGEVIKGTEVQYKDYVRFYFRPLTPTQYHNEGIRADREITDLGAHCPVPVFLLFDTSILDNPNVYFSYESLASHHDVQLYQGCEDLSKAPFEYIYHNSGTSMTDGKMIRKHRQAEIVVKNQCDLTYLKRIVCRTVAEADTLKTLLNSTAYSKYADKICVVGDRDFETQDSSTIFKGGYLKILNTIQTSTYFTMFFNKKDCHKRSIGIYWYDVDRNKITAYINKDISLGKYGPAVKINLFEKLKGYDYVQVVILIDGNLVYTKKFSGLLS